MKYIYFLILIFYSVACQSTAKYRAIKKSRNPEYSRSTSRAHNLEPMINQWLGVPYKYGGMSKRGIDCSGLTSIIYRDVYSKEIPRTARDQYLAGRKISLNYARYGDLIFFRGVRGSGIDHVGIYLDSGRFVHASINSGVIISNLSEEYYDKRFVGVCRY